MSVSLETGLHASILYLASVSKSFCACFPRRMGFGQMIGSLIMTATRWQWPICLDIVHCNPRPRLGTKPKRELLLMTVVIATLFGFGYLRSFVMPNRGSGPRANPKAAQYLRASMQIRTIQTDAHTVGLRTIVHKPTSQNKGFPGSRKPVVPSWGALENTERLRF